MKKQTWPEGSIVKIEFWHFHKRLRERYGLQLKPGEFDNIQKSIRSGDIKPLKNIGYRGNQNCRVFVYHYPLKKTKSHTLYCR